jgi:hypothetical protein
MADIVKVALWLIVLSGGWTVARRLRRLEHTFRSPGPAQDTDQSIERVAAEVRLLLRRQERSTRLLAQRLAQLEQRLGTRPTPGSLTVSGNRQPMEQRVGRRGSNLAAPTPTKPLWR